MPSHLIRALCLGLFVIAHANHAPAHPASDDWPQWRGPDGTGAAPHADPVDALSLKDNHNIKWATEMPGQTAATPAVIENHVFTTAGTPKTNRLLAIGVDRDTGEIRWQYDVAEARQSRSRSRENNHAECSPVADHKHAYFLFGTGDLLAFTHAGEKQWHINLSKKLGKIEILWGYASSPLLHDNKLYIQILRRKPNSLVLCVDADTGKILWKQERPTTAKGESFESYASPILADIDGKPQIVVYGGDALTGHDPDTGKEIWRFTEGLNPTNDKMFRVISGPTQGPNGLIYLTTPRGEDLFAIQVNNNQPTLKWMTRKVNADVPCPVYAHGHLFVLSGSKKTIFKINADTGEKIWSKRLDTPGYFRCTPTVAGDNLYLITGDGDLFILSAGDTFQQKHTTPLGGYPARATIAAAANDLYIRTGTHLIKAGNQPTRQQPEN